MTFTFSLIVRALPETMDNQRGCQQWKFGLFEAERTVHHEQGRFAFYILFTQMKGGDVELHTLSKVSEN